MEATTTSELRIRIPVMFDTKTQTFDDRESLTRRTAQGTNRRGVTRKHADILSIIMNMEIQPRGLAISEWF